MTQLARMRTITAAIEQLKTEDPGTCLTESALRSMIKRGAVPYVKVNSKYLVNYDALISKLISGDCETSRDIEEGVIRRVQ